MRDSIKNSYYGWFVVAACFVSSLGGVSIIVNALGTFIKPVSTALGFDRSQLSLCVSLSSICSTLSLVWWGGYFRRRGHRRAMIAVGIMVPLLILTMSICRRVWQFMLISALLGLFYGPVSTLSTSSLLGKWFSRKRGTAIGIASAGSGIGSMLIIPLISAAIAAFDFRAAYRIVAVIYALTVLPAALFVIRNGPEEMGLKIDGADTGETGTEGSLSAAKLSGMTRKEALRTKRFYVYLLMVALGGTLYGGMLNHLYAYLTDMGVAASAASGSISLMMGFLFVSKLAVGWLNDRIGTRICVLIQLSFYALAFVALLGMPFGLPAPFVSVFGGFGASFGALGLSLMTMSLYGNREYSSIHGIVMSVYMAGMALGTSETGMIFDAAGSYRGAWILDLCVTIVCIVLCIAIFGKKRSPQAAAADEALGGTLE